MPFHSFCCTFPLSCAHTVSFFLWLACMLTTTDTFSVCPWYAFPPFPCCFSLFSHTFHISLMCFRFLSFLLYCVHFLSDRIFHFPILTLRLVCSRVPCLYCECLSLLHSLGPSQIVPFLIEYLSHPLSVPVACFLFLPIVKGFLSSHTCFPCPVHLFFSQTLFTLSSNALIPLPHSLSSKHLSVMQCSFNV